VRARERQSALTVPTVTHAVRTITAFPDLPEANDMPASMRHYRVRLRRSRRLPYRMARLLLFALAFALLIIVFVVAGR
jgi:hypothetical protein